MICTLADKSTSDKPTIAHSYSLMHADLMNTFAHFLVSCSCSASPMKASDRVSGREKAGSVVFLLCGCQ
jgi:hypothetical protein